MERSDIEHAQARLTHLKDLYQVNVETDWGDGDGGWQPGTWKKDEFDKLHDSIALMANLMGGPEKFARHLGGVTVIKKDMGSHGGEALAHKVMLSVKGSFSPWTVIHEFAHSWDASYNWRLSRLLEKYTGGFTSPTLALLKRMARLADCGVTKAENKPGRYGRKPGCNRAGYFYGDRPSGSNWAFNRVEDFAESVAMYMGWGRGNDLSEWAQARIDRYLKPNGTAITGFGVDNWMDYRKYFYPDEGDYRKTKRWQFVDDLVNERIAVR